MCCSLPTDVVSVHRIVKGITVGEAKKAVEFRPSLYRAMQVLRPPQRVCSSIGVEHTLCGI